MFQPHSDTSKAAYHSLNRESKRTLQDKIIAVIQEAGQDGITAGWISQKLSVPNSTIGARIVELEEAGKVFRLHKTAKNPSDRHANLIVSMGYRVFYTVDDIATPVKYNKGVAGVVPIQNHKAEKMKAFIVELELALSQGRFISPNSDWHKRATALVE